MIKNNIIYLLILGLLGTILAITIQKLFNTNQIVTFIFTFILLYLIFYFLKKESPEENNKIN